MKGTLKFGFVVRYVKDMAAARRFYAEVLGLSVEREHPDFIQFDRFALAADNPMDGQAGQEVFWLTDDADEALRLLSGKAEVCFPLTQFPFGRVFGVSDPDGLPRYMLELATNRPSCPAI